MNRANISKGDSNFDTPNTNYSMVRQNLNHLVRQNSNHSVDAGFESSSQHFLSFSLFKNLNFFELFFFLLNFKIQYCEE